MNKINPVDTEIYLLGDFNFNLFLNNSYILEKKRISGLTNQLQLMLKAAMSLVHFLD